MLAWGRSVVHVQGFLQRRVIAHTGGRRAHLAGMRQRLYRQGIGEALEDRQKHVAAGAARADAELEIELVRREAGPPSLPQAHRCAASSPPRPTARRHWRPRAGQAERLWEPVGPPDGCVDS